MNADREDPIQGETKYFRELSAAYTDGIRSTDFKASIALLFLPLLMVPILDAHEKGLAQIPLWVILAPFLISYFFLVLSIFPRYRSSARSTFHLSRDASPSHFTYTHDPLAALEEVQHRVAILSRILWWKTLYIRIALGVVLIGIPIFGGALAFFGS